MTKEYFARCIGCLEVVYFPDNKKEYLCPNGCPVKFTPKDISVRERDD